MKVLVLIGILLLTHIIITYLINKQFETEHMVDLSPVDKDKEIKWKRNESCKYNMTKTINTVLDENNIKETKGDDWLIYMPCTYNNISSEINDMKPLSNDQRFFIVNNADQLTSKSAIWENLVKKYGRDKARIIAPTTYLLNSEADIELLKKEHNQNPDRIYIMKKNVQRQQGLKITKDLDDIVNNKDKGFVVAQELLQDPYTINGRKINMRFYVLLVCRHNEVSAYVHKEGFMYYTKDLFKKSSTEDGPNITTGYIDRKVYDENPLTHGDFRRYLDDSRNRQLSKPELNIIKQNKESVSEILFGRIYFMLKQTVDAVSNTVCIDSKLRNFITFQLFGFDVAINDQLIPQLIEINKGPDLGTKDEKDGKIKHKVVSDIFRVIKTLDGDHNYLKIVDT